MDKNTNPPMQWHSGVHAIDAMNQPHVTLLDHFACQAMQGLCASSGMHIIAEHGSKKAYEIAKAMLKARQEALKESEVNNG